jgi:hypothetical protein
MAHIQPLGPAPSDQVFRVEGRVFGGDAQVSQHDVADVLRAMHGRSDGRAVLRRGDGWWEGERHFLAVRILFSLLEIFTARAESGLFDRDYMAGILNPGWRLFEARKFEDEVASGENWNFEPLGEFEQRNCVFFNRTLAIERYRSREKGIIIVHASS